MKRSPRFNHIARICVVGVGGGGNNAVNRMIRGGVRGVDFVAVNTETLALLRSEAPTRIQIGEGGQGTGGDITRGKQAAIASKNEILRVLRGADLVFVTAGLGGGTGSGAAPIIGQLAREQGALTIGVVTHPFSFEGKQRMDNARYGIEQLEQSVDTLIAIPNDQLFNVAESRTPLGDAFRHADDILRQAVKSISDVVTKTGTINLDFADVRTVMSAGGSSIMAIGQAEGEDRARIAAEEAVNSNFLGISVDGAQGILLNVTASSQLSAVELQTASDIICSRADFDVNFILGVVEDESMGDTLRLTMIATGFEAVMPAQQVQDVMDSIDMQVNPPEEKVETRRVYLSRPKKRQHSNARSTNPRFSTKRWGIPTYLRN